MSSSSKCVRSPPPRSRFFGIFSDPKWVKFDPIPFSVTAFPPPPPPLPPVSKPVVVWPDAPDGPSIFKVLNLFRSHWFIHRDHLVANLLSAQWGEDGSFVWIDFQTPFHTHLVQCMCAVLPPLCPVAKGKKVMFVFLLEILDGQGPGQFFSLDRVKPKKSQPCRKASSQASPPPPPLSAHSHSGAPAPAPKLAAPAPPPVPGPLKPKAMGSDLVPMLVDEDPLALTGPLYPPAMSRTTVMLPPALHASTHSFLTTDSFLTLPVDLSSLVGHVDLALKAWFVRGMAAGVSQHVLMDVVETAEVWCHICGLDRTPFDLPPGHNSNACCPPGHSFPLPPG
jgi:hypothetical protein